MLTELITPCSTNSPVEAFAKTEKKYRACSFWFTWKYLNWPDADIRDLIIRRADANAEAGVNLAIVFGIHFRWDFLPIINRVHDLLAFTAEQLHQRNIEFFDHHSSVLTHRPENHEERQDIWNRNRHHLPFYPDCEFASTLQFNGTFLNSWRMVGIDDNKPIYIERYTCEQFCMNNPDFRDAYAAYIKKLAGEVQLDGLMSDDAVYYPGWKACGCRHCREKFQNRYGINLPPVSDDSFWSNRENPDFRNWIKFRYESSKEFLAMVRENLNEDMKLMTCCSDSESVKCNASGMSAEDFAPSSDLLMLEMCGEILDTDGKWAFRIPSQLLQLAIARESNLPCLGLGYGFFRDSFNMIWAIDRFLSADVWLSTLRGRLGLPDSTTKELPDESEICDECFGWDKKHEHLFQGTAEAEVMVIFSRPTRDYFAKSDNECISSFESICKMLFEFVITFEVANRIPEFGKIKVVILPWAVCLSAEDRNLLEKFINDGGTLITFGGIGLKDENGRDSNQWLEKFGISQKLIRTATMGGWFVMNDIEETGECRCESFFENSNIPQNDWKTIVVKKGKLLWHAGELNSERNRKEFLEKVTAEINPALRVLHAPKDWYTRLYRKDNRYLLHAIPSRVDSVQHPEMRNHFLNGQPIIHEIKYNNLDNDFIKIGLKGRVASAKLYSIDLPHELRGEVKYENNFSEIHFPLTGIQRFLSIEIIENSCFL